MLERVAVGEFPRRPHTQYYVNDRLCYEHCITREGFDGPFTIQYHLQRPQAAVLAESTVQLPKLSATKLNPLARRHFRVTPAPSSGGPTTARLPLLFNADVCLSRVQPSASEDTYFSNADGDTLLFVHAGGGTLISAFGNLSFGPADYVFVPKGIPHRFEINQATQHWFEMELSSGFGFPSGSTNSSGQLRLDAPLSHRDFRKPAFRGPFDEGLRTILIKREGALSALEYPHSPMDVIGYDGCVYPFAVSVHAFRPKVGAVHLPPTAHACFQSRGALICNFVPRPLDFHPQAVPCPYPHSSVDIDEVLFYSEGDFTSRLGVGPGSISWHPRGLPHGPHPGRYEASLGSKSTCELAIMLDCSQPLRATPEGIQTEDVSYEKSFV